MANSFGDTISDLDYATQRWKSWKAEAERLRTGLAGVRQLVDQQAEDAGLWFFARTAAEAYVQQELRKLHAAIEALTSDKAN